MKKKEIIAKEKREEMKEVLGDLLGDLSEITVDDLGPEIIENLEQSRIVELAREKKFLLRGLKSEAVKSISTQKKIYSQRLTLVEGELNRKLSLIKARQAGYSPFTVNPTWFGGFLEKPSSKVLKGYTEQIYRDREYITVTRRPYSLFQQAIPQVVLEKYKKAKELDLFDVLIVYSPREEDFTRVGEKTKKKNEVLPPLRPVKDSILVGLIGLNGPIQVACSEKPTRIIAPDDKFISFFVAAWNLGKDLDS